MIAVLGFFVLYLVVFFFASLIVTATGVDIVTGTTAVITTLSNVGPGLNLVGPTQNFQHPATPGQGGAHLLHAGRPARTVYHRRAAHPGILADGAKTFLPPLRLSETRTGKRFSCQHFTLTRTFMNEYDIAVIGAGHAGCEAALAAPEWAAGPWSAIINADTIGAMSCNPAIGGLAKGHLVREIDALGGEMARNIDATSIQFRRLNTSKGPAVRSSRAQADRLLYRLRMKIGPGKPGEPGDPPDGG